MKNSTEPLKAQLAKTELEVKQLKEALEQSRKENAILAGVKPPQSNNDLIGNRNSKLDSPNEVQIPNLHTDSDKSLDD